MIRMTVLYPGGPEEHFDLDYYLERHMPMVRERLGAALLRDEIWTGAGTLDGQDPPNRVLLHMYFADRASFDDAFAVAGEEILADIPSYTDIAAVVQFDAPSGA